MAHVSRITGRAATGLRVHTRWLSTERVENKGRDAAPQLNENASEESDATSDFAKGFFSRLQRAVVDEDKKPAPELVFGLRQKDYSTELQDNLKLMQRRNRERERVDAEILRKREAERMIEYRLAMASAASKEAVKAASAADGPTKGNISGGYEHESYKSGTGREFSPFLLLLALPAFYLFGVVILAGRDESTRKWVEDNVPMIGRSMANQARPTAKGTVIKPEILASLGYKDGDIGKFSSAKEELAFVEAAIESIEGR